MCAVSRVILGGNGSLRLFVLLQDAQIALAGDVWGPYADLHKPGGSLGVKNGIEGIVAGVVIHIATITPTTVRWSDPPVSN